MKIKKYDDFVNEEINLKKAIATGAMAASLAACGPNDSINRVNNLPKVDRIEQVDVDRTEQVEVAKDFKDLPNDFDMDQELLTIGMDMTITSGVEILMVELKKELLTGVEHLSYLIILIKRLLLRNKKFSVYIL